jgi:hypothetical protein
MLQLPAVVIVAAAVRVVAAVNNINYYHKKRELALALSFILTNILTHFEYYLLLKIEIVAPNNPIKARPKITNPMGIFGKPVSSEV